MNDSINTEKEVMKKKWNLSEKLDNEEKALICLLPSDYEKVDYKVLDDVRKHIKEFIKRDWELIKRFIDGEFDLYNLKIKRDKLAGGNLICQK